MDEENVGFALIKHEGRYLDADHCLTRPAYTGYDEYNTKEVHEHVWEGDVPYSSLPWWELPNWIKGYR